MASSIHHHVGRVQLTVTLLDVKPRIWRTLLVAPSLTLGQLHQVLQVAMGWTDSHLHQFRARDGQRFVPPVDLAEDDGPLGDEPEPLDETSVLVASALPSQGSDLLYDYDFGDGWCHRIVHEGVPSATLAKDVPIDQVAWCVAGARACPLEDCGGPLRHQQIARLVGRRASTKPPRSIELRELLAWIPAGYDPADFDIGAVDATLARLHLLGRRDKSGTVRKQRTRPRVRRQRGP